MIGNTGLNAGNHNYYDCSRFTKATRSSKIWIAAFVAIAMGAFAGGGYVWTKEGLQAAQWQAHLDYSREAQR